MATPVNTLLAVAGVRTVHPAPLHLAVHALCIAISPVFMAINPYSHRMLDFTHRALRMTPISATLRGQ